MTDFNPQTTRLSDAAVLVEISFSQFGNSKLDKKGSAEATQAHSAEEGAVRLNKSLFVNCAELKAVKTFIGSTRTIHYKYCMPWSFTGVALLPTAMFPEYSQVMSQRQHEFSGLVNKFLDVYDVEVARQQISLGDLFDALEYPTREQMANKFGINIVYSPVPMAGDFRVDIDNETRQQMESQYNQFLHGALSRAEGEIKSRVVDALDRMSDKLDYADYEDKDTRKVFKDTLVTNVVELIDSLDTYNMSGDDTMVRVRSRLNDIMQGVSAAQLRHNADVRAETKKKVDDVLAKLPSLGW